MTETRTVTIVEFLEARLAEDERVALLDPMDFGRGQLEVAAKRAIVVAYSEIWQEARRLAYERGAFDGELLTARAMYGGLKLALVALASVYADHRDFDPAWA